MTTEHRHQRPQLAALLRWDLTVRLMLAATVPPLVQLALIGEVSDAGVSAALTALLVSFASPGPDLAVRRWTMVAVLATPIAIVVGAAAGLTAASGVLWVFTLFVVHGAMLQAGAPAQLAWFPVAAAGMLAALLITEPLRLLELAAGCITGSAWAAVLIAAVPLVIRPPRLMVPQSAFAVDTARLARMVRAPHLSDWVLPLLLGGLASALLLVANAATGGFRPYWAVLAMISVLGPTAASTRRSAAQVIVSATAGVGLAALLVAAPWPEAAVLAVATAMVLAGALLLLVSGTVSKALTTPLPVLAAAAALGEDGVLALQARLVEYTVGVLVGLAVAAAAEELTRRLSVDRAPAPVA